VSGKILISKLAGDDAKADSADISPSDLSCRRPQKNLKEGNIQRNIEGQDKLA
jgi:hypothetical protein